MKGAFSKNLDSDELVEDLKYKVLLVSQYVIANLKTFDVLSILFF